MKVTKVLISLLTIFLFVGNYVHAAAYTNPDKISSLAVYGVGNIGVGMIDTNMTNPSNCANTTSHKIYKLIDTTDHGKNMYAMMLTAKASSTNVRLLIDEADCSLYGYAIIVGIIF